MLDGAEVLRSWQSGWVDFPRRIKSANVKVLLGAIALSGSVVGIAFADQVDQVSKPILVAAASSATASSGMRHRGGCGKVFLTVTPDYIMGPEDVLEITGGKMLICPNRSRFGRWKNFTSSIGDVSAVGRTAAQLTEEISARLKSYMENPTVSILVREVNSYQIYVLGEVNAPGKYPLKSKTTLLQAITIAHGFTQVAARNKIVVFRFGKKMVRVKQNQGKLRRYCAQRWF